MLPNLRVFKFDIPWIDKPSGKSFRLVNPNTKLEVIKNHGDSELIELVLGSSTCTRLRELDLAFPTSGGGHRNPGTGLFPFIQGMPALKKLTLNCGKIGIQDFEYLHSKAPVLESPMLTDVSLEIGELPDNIVPAICVTSFRIETLSVWDSRNQGNWYTYMARKYTSLIDFYCNNMELRDAGSDAAMIIYRDGLIPIYRTFGSYLFDINVVKIPHELDIDLKFDEGYQGINLNEHLNAFPPTLVKFSVNCTDLEVTNVPNRSCNIRELFLDCPKLSKLLGQLMSTCFPKLIDLDLREKLSETISFNLPTHHFQSISLHIESETYPNCFSFKYTNNPQNVYYFDKNNPKGIIIEPTASEEFQNITNVEFKCASAKKLWLNSGKFNGMS